MRALNARGLESRGFTVIQAGNGVEAMEEIERLGGKIDLVVSDVVMPEMDGPTLLKELRKTQSRHQDHLRVGLRRGRLPEEPAERDDYNFLAKPFTLKQLVAKVKDTMGA